MQVCLAGVRHLVSRHGEFLKLYVKLWVASRGSGKLGLGSLFPAAKQTQTCDSNYDLHNERDREKGGRSWAEMSPFPLRLMSDHDIMCTGGAVSLG